MPSHLDSHSTGPALRPFALWHGAAAGWACLFVGIGLARFGYSPLIPELVRERWFAPAGADYLAAINLAGYLLGALVAGQYLSRRPAGRWVRASLLVAAGSFWACVRPWGFVWFLAWRLLAGVAAGLLMVLGVPTVLARTPPHRRGVVGGVLFSGIGAGVVVAGAAVPRLMRWGLTAAWAGLGALSLLAAAAGWSYWRAEPGAAAVAAAARHARDQPRLKLSSGLALLMAAYIACAVGYVPHSLFWVDYIARELGHGLAAGGTAYMELGMAAMVGSALTGFLGDRFGFRRCLAWGLLIEAAAVALPLVGSTPAWLALSSVGVGATQIGATAMTSARSVELAPPEVQKQAWGWLTLAFSIAYAGGGGLFTLAYSRLHSYRPLFGAAALSLLAASVLASLAG